MLGNQDLSKRCGLPKSTVSRLTQYPHQARLSGVRRGQRQVQPRHCHLSLGSAMLSRLDIRKLAHPLMQELAEFGQCMVSLGTRDRLSMIYIDAVRGSAAVTLSLDSGARIQIATSAMGRAYLTAVPETERNDIMERVRELADPMIGGRICSAAWPGRCATSASSACAAPSAIGRRMSMRIALPVRPGGGLPPMAINCGAPAYMVSKEFLLEKVRPRLIALANELETSLGTNSQEPCLLGRAGGGAPIGRRLTRPSAKCAGKGTAGGESQQIGHVADACAAARSGRPGPARGAFRRESPCRWCRPRPISAAKCGRSYGEVPRHPPGTARRQQGAASGLREPALECCRARSGTGIEARSHHGAAPVPDCRRPADARSLSASKTNRVRGGAKLQGCTQQPLKVLDLGRRHRGEIRCATANSHVRSTSGTSADTRRPGRRPIRRPPRRPVRSRSDIPIRSARIRIRWRRSPTWQ